MDKKYLPSEKFIARVIIITILVVIFLGVYQLVKYIKLKIEKRNTESDKTELVVGNIIQKDSNGNGIADWEEYLWGLNPNKNGESNKQTILEKKQSLTPTEKIINEPTSDNEMLSRQFFAVIIALQQTGELNDEIMYEISNSIGQEVKPLIINDTYTKDMIEVSPDSNESTDSYLASFENLVNKYKENDIGSELTLISQGLGNNDPQALKAVGSIASSYKAFGKDLIKIKVPNKIVTLHTSLANNYEKTGESLEKLTLILSDQIIGMKAILSYKKYSDDLVSDIEKISAILE